MDATLSERLRAGGQSLALELDTRVLGLLSRYLDVLLLWNRRINLTAVREPGAIVDKHLIDSLAVLPHVPASACTLLDVGSGAGLPGVVLAAARPELRVTLVESNRKKAAFLQAVRREVPLPNLEVWAERIETVQGRADFRPFDVAISRATWDVTTWLSIGSLLVRPKSGVVLAMEGAERAPLPAQSSRYSYEIAGARRSIVVQVVTAEPA